jgi:hypothetical protein
VDKVERVQRRFERYARRILPPYEHGCALLRLDTFVKRRSIAYNVYLRYSK